MQKRRLYFLLWCAVLVLAAVLRLPHLQHRPMHTDEAVHAVKFGALLESGSYAYDANEYHGPTLNAFSLIPAWLRGQASFADLDEITLRIVPVIFGLGLVLLPLLFLPFAGRSAALAAAFWIAISPMQVFYSRYYIQEVLFVFFSFALLLCFFRYCASGHWSWALAVGLALGFLHATKETDILILAAATAAGLAVWLDGRHPLRVPRTRLLIFFSAALVVSGFFFSSFLVHPQGILDSFRTYQTYFQRGAGQTLHVQPWYYYFRLLFFFHAPGKSIWSEAWVLPFVMAGIYAAFRRTKRPEDEAGLPFARFFIYFTLILCALYAAIPYKTPWNASGFYYGMLLLGGRGAVELLHLLKKRMVVAVALVVLCAILLARQAILINSTYDSDPCNPWVYAHPGPDVERISTAVELAARSGPDGTSTFVEVVVPGDEYWPLPWTLRKLQNVGWYSAVNERIPAAPIILITPDQEPALLHQLYEVPPPGKRDLYVPLWQAYTELRPALEIRGYIRKDLQDAMTANAALQPAE
jgi:uncharacterized protein (TIGR03663 family)